MQLENVYLYCILSVIEIEVADLCYSSANITLHDSNVDVTITDNPCQLKINTTADKHIVAVIYNVTNDCLEKGKIQIFDGGMSINNLAVVYCKGVPASYASRYHTLILRPDATKPLKPISIDVWLVDVVQKLKNMSGIVTSERFPGYIFGEGKALTSANNFQGIYDVQFGINVTVVLQFLEFRIKSPCERDYLKVIFPSINLSMIFCGDSNRPNFDIPTPMSLVTDAIMMEFQTDEDDTLSGFTLQYAACIDEVKECCSGTFFLPLNLTETQPTDMVCAFSVKLKGSFRIVFMELTMVTSKVCLDVMQIYVDGEDVTKQVLVDCKFTTPLNVSVTASNVALMFRSTDSFEFLRGNYSIEIIDSEELTTTEIQTTADTTSLPVGDSTSNDSTSDETFDMETSKMNMTVTMSSVYTLRDEIAGENYTTTIIGLIVAVSILIIVTTGLVIYILCRRKNVKKLKPTAEPSTESQYADIDESHMALPYIELQLRRRTQDHHYEDMQQRRQIKEPSYTELPYLKGHHSQTQTKRLTLVSNATRANGEMSIVHKMSNINV